MDTYHKRPLRPARCRGCALPATWIVEGGTTNYFVGQYCDTHADEAIEARKKYEVGLQNVINQRRR